MAAPPAGHSGSVGGRTIREDPMGTTEDMLALYQLQALYGHVSGGASR